jgi:predicted alpha-1,2-mannosidase
MPLPKAGRLEEWYGCMECNLYQQGWFVPHDVKGMIQLLGGREKVLTDLQAMFEKTPKDYLWNAYYNHANEPVHHIPFLFNYLNVPWLTQKWTRDICQNAYHNSVKGLVGNEDVGQMSAWYIFSAMGFYPVNPSDGKYQLGTPMFKKVTIKLGQDRKFVIKANRENNQYIYVKEVLLNGEKLDRTWITHDEIMNGGELEFVLTSEIPQK